MVWLLRSCRGHPVLLGRAPLRLRTAYCSASQPRRHPVLLGRAPLRPEQCAGDLREVRRVIPSYSDGLHCGSIFDRDTSGGSACHPVLLGRAPLRRRSGNPRAVLCRRHPVLLGRAPLRRRLDGLPRPQSGGHPVLLGRAPLRREPGRVPRLEVARHPVLLGRAPLRPRHPWRSTVTRMRHPVLLGRAPLRRGAACCRASCGPGVIPSYSDGLHCGIAISKSTSRWVICHPVLLGRAPLRQQQPRQLKEPARVGHPVLLGRAPLRQGCGAASSGRAMRSSRPTRTGSIAAASRSDLPVLVRSHPVLLGRAPLRRGLAGPGR